MDIQGFSIWIFKGFPIGFPMGFSMDPIRGFYMDNQGFLMGIIMGILWEILFMNNEGFSEHFLWVCSSSISPPCLGCSVCRSGSRSFVFLAKRLLTMMTAPMINPSDRGMPSPMMPVLDELDMLYMIYGSSLGLERRGNIYLVGGPSWD